ncbi:unnamed protein product [Pedinophyceae sp. YPF-701]|nr:unnamed protein product [Pedinophyceae sp. YPF-701]
MDTQIAEAVSYLQAVRSTDGLSVFDHLSGLVKKILEEKPMEAVDMLEASMLTRKANNHPDQTDDLLPAAPNEEERARAKAERSLYRSAEVGIDEGTGEAADTEPPNDFECEDVMQHAHMLDLVGCGLNRTEMYGVMMAMRKLGEDPNIKAATVRFFGKILGTHADYYVFETTLKEAPGGEDEALAPGEVPAEKGVGTNAYVYYVCNHLGGKFSKLPDVTPKQIKAARTIKKFVTGNLAAPVSAYPVYPGKEAEFLRAQIARIAHTTVLCPKDFFLVDEGEMSRNEEYEAKTFDDLLAMENWSHRYPHVKMQGRCEVWRPEPEGDEEEEEKEPTEEEAEEGPEQLSTVEADGAVLGGAAWTPVPSSGLPGVKNKIVALRSNLWPGAVSVSNGNQFCNVYVGHGLKNEVFTPMPPPAVALEYDQKLMESTDLPPKVEDKPEGEEEE